MPWNGEISHQLPHKFLTDLQPFLKKHKEYLYMLFRFNRNNYLKMEFTLKEYLLPGTCTYSDLHLHIVLI